MSALSQLAVLLRRHSRVLMPSLLCIMDALPETLDPSKFQHLLPEVSPPFNTACVLVVGVVAEHAVCL